MSESFIRGAWHVTFSNGATESLFGALVILGERSSVARTAAGAAVLEFLRRLLAAGSPGARAFRLEPVTEELADPERLRVLAVLVGEFAHALALPQPDPMLTDITWDRDLRLSWLARVEMLHEMLADALPRDQGCAPLALDLDDATAAEVDAERLLHVYRFVLRRGTTAEKIGHIDRTLALLEAAGATQRRANTVFSLMSDKADMLVKAGDRKQAAKVLCEAAAFTDDVELAQATMDYAASLEGAAP